jgi:hypothetical protein
MKVVFRRDDKVTDVLTKHLVGQTLVDQMVFNQEAWHQKSKRFNVKVFKVS